MIPGNIVYRNSGRTTTKNEKVADICVPVWRRIAHPDVVCNITAYDKGYRQIEQIDLVLLYFADEF